MKSAPSLDDGKLDPKTYRKQQECTTFSLSHFQLNHKSLGAVSKSLKDGRDDAVDTANVREDHERPGTPP